MSGFSTIKEGGETLQVANLQKLEGSVPTDYLLIVLLY